MSVKDESCRTKRTKVLVRLSSISAPSKRWQAVQVLPKKQRQQEELDLLLSKFNLVLAHLVEIALANGVPLARRLGPSEPATFLVALSLSCVSYTPCWLDKVSMTKQSCKVQFSTASQRSTA